MGHSRSSAMSPFGRAHTTSYSTCASILYHFRDIASYLSKVADFNPPYAPAIGAPCWGWPRSNFTKMFGTLNYWNPWAVAWLCYNVILRSAVLIEHWLLTDTDRRTCRHTYDHSSSGKTGGLSEAMVQCYLLRNGLSRLHKIRTILRVECSRHATLRYTVRFARQKHTHRMHYKKKFR